MQRRDWTFLGIILAILLFAIWVDLPSNRGIHIALGPIKIDRNIRVHQGLDLQGGVQVLLEADMPPGQEVTADAMNAARAIVENRVNALGVTEPLVQSVGTNRIAVELPGIEDPEQAIAAIRETGLLEFVDAGLTPLLPGTVVRTSYTEYGILGSVPTPTPGPETPTPAVTASATITATETLTVTGAASPTPLPEATPEQKVYATILTGRYLASVALGFDQTTRSPEILLEFTPEGTQIFAQYTQNNIGTYLAIALDKTIISSPQIQSAIPDGKARITGGFTVAEAQSVVVQLRYGALPVPLKVVERRTVGPTLGQDSVQKSVTAGAIGLIVVLIFMLTYYRLPGVVSDLALLIYALLTFALFKLIPVTLTLPGIAGFLLSVGTAVDANILIFERMKEELRRGRPLGRAIEAGFDRAWTSILDSNLAVFITCIILWFFGSTFGASIVKGFAVTLFVGVAVSMFSAVTVTRTFLRLLFHIGGEKLRDKSWLFGI